MINPIFDLLENAESDLVVVAPKSVESAHFRFACKYLLGNRLGLTNYKFDFKESVDAYSIELGGKPIFRFPVSDFFVEIEKYISGKLTPNCKGVEKDWSPFYCETSGIFNVNFDLFAAVFYLLARVDELLPNAKRDEHKRILASSTIQFKSNAHRFPVIDFWVQKIRNEFSENGISTSKETFEWWNTVDIDQIRASVGKPLISRIGNISRKLKRFQFAEAKLLLQTFFAKPDPFDVLHQMHSTKSRDFAFYLVAGNSIYDHGSTRNNKLIDYDVKKIKQRFEIGLHPSYNSFQDMSLLEHEKQLLEEYCAKSITYSRQHYLHYNWPATPLALQNIGISHDFTMGFADDIGFRAGTSRPFPFYNLIEQKEYQLTIVPFAVMDVTLIKYLKIGPRESIKLIFDLIENVKNANGLFVSLWHNESLSQIDGWKGWDKVYFEMKNHLTS